MSNIKLKIDEFLKNSNSKTKEQIENLNSISKSAYILTKLILLSDDDKLLMRNVMDIFEENGLSQKDIYTYIAEIHQADSELPSSYNEIRPEKRILLTPKMFEVVNSMTTQEYCFTSLLNGWASTQNIEESLKYVITPDEEEWLIQYLAGDKDIKVVKYNAKD